MSSNAPDYAPFQVENDVTMTHLEVLEKIHRYAAGFQKNGVRPGEHVCVHLNNSMIGLVAMYSVVCAGATAVLAEPELGIGKGQMERRFEIPQSSSFVEGNALFCDFLAAHLEGV